MSFRILFAKQTNFFSLRKSFSSTVTTPIFYLNSDPHIGHLYTLVLADCIARWKSFQGDNVIFTTGKS